MDGYLQVRHACPACGTELHHHRADDGPAWATILITGHVMAPVMLAVFLAWHPEGWQMAIGFSVVFVALSLWLLPRFKGALRRPAVGEAHARLRTARAALPPAPERRPADPRRRHRHPGAARSRTAPRCSMGQRGGGAAFMPDKFVFPGGAVDPEDGLLPGEPALDPLTARRLADGRPARRSSRASPRAAVRELWEETGLMLGLPDPAAPTLAVPAVLAGLLRRAASCRTCAALRFVFRAITPPGRPRRFDARFFLVEARELAGDEPRRLGRGARAPAVARPSPAPRALPLALHHRGGALRGRGAHRRPRPGAAGALLPPDRRRARASACSDP